MRVADRRASAAPVAQAPRPALTLAAAVIGLFMVTLDAVIVNVALPSIRRDLGGGITGLQWVVDGYTVMFAALLLSSGSLADRLGARRAFAVGLAVFTLASAGCGLAPDVGVLVAARFVQGSAAAALMPASMALVRQAYPEPARRARAIGVWAMGGSIAAASGPVLGGLLTLASWRWIFVVNVPVGAAALVLMARVDPSPRRDAPQDWPGLATAVIGMGALTYGAIELGADGIGAPAVITAFAVAAVALVGFVSVQARVAHPMLPLGLFGVRNVSVASLIGFAFMVGYYGMPFVMSLYLQERRGFSALSTGVVFVPMMVIGTFVTPFTARLGELVGRTRLVTSGLVSMVAGLAAMAALATSSPTVVVAVLMTLVGLGGPLAMPTVTATLLDSVEADRAGTAGGIFNTSRQVGGALSVAVFGALLAQRAGFAVGVRACLALAAGLTVMAVVASRFLRPSVHRHDGGPRR